LIWVLEFGWIDVFKSSACSLDLNFGGCPFKFVVVVWLRLEVVATMGCCCTRSEVVATMGCYCTESKVVAAVVGYRTIVFFFFATLG